VLAELDEYPPALLEHLQCPQRTPLVAGLEHVVLLLCVFELVPLVECGPVAVAVLVPACPWLSTRVGLTR
jgi:hypothetical protein